MVIPKKQIGIGLVGAGRMGSLRAHLSATSPQVDFLAISDIDKEKAKGLAQQTEAAFFSDDNRAVIENPNVDAVIVSTPEGEHTEWICLALENQKPVLVEKPIALSLEDADKILDVQKKTGTELYIGYTQRLRRKFLSVKEHIQDGRLGKVMSGRLCIYNPMSVAKQVYQRAPHASPISDALTYMADMALWFFEPLKPVRVYALGGSKIFSEHPDQLGDYGWAIVTFEDGSAVNLGSSWILPEKWPATVATISMDIFGSEGAIRIDDGHKDVMMVSEEETPSSYVPDSSFNVSFLGSAMPGDWVVGEFVGPMRDETRLFVERVTTGKEIPLCDANAGRNALELTVAMETSARQGGKVIDLPLKG